LLDQVVDVVRARLIDPATEDPVALAGIARRLVAIDPDRAGIGGLRLQLELALFSGLPAAAAAPVTARPAAAEPARPGRGGPPPVTAKVQTYTQGASVAAESAESAAPVPPTASAEAQVETPVEQPPREPVAVSIGVGDDLDRLVTDWPTIVGSVRPATRAVLTECRPIAVDGNVVTLGFPEAKAFLKDHAERRREEVEAAVGGHLGREISVRSVATNIEVAPLVAVDDLVAEARRIFGEDLVDVAEVD
jgi:hypothetical protein